MGDIIKKNNGYLDINGIKSIDSDDDYHSNLHHTNLKKEIQCQRQ